MLNVYNVGTCELYCLIELGLLRIVLKFGGPRGSSFHVRANFVYDFTHFLSYCFGLRAGENRRKPSDVMVISDVRVPRYSHLCVGHDQRLVESGSLGDFSTTTQQAEQRLVESGSLGDFPLLRLLRYTSAVFVTWTPLGEYKLLVGLMRRR